MLLLLALMRSPKETSCISLSDKRESITSTSQAAAGVRSCIKTWSRRTRTSWQLVEGAGLFTPAPPQRPPRVKTLRRELQEWLGQAPIGVREGRAELREEEEVVAEAEKSSTTELRDKVGPGVMADQEMGCKAVAVEVAA